MSEQAVAYLIGLALVLLFLFAAVRMLRRPAATPQDNERMASIEQRLTAAEGQLSAIKITVQHLPTAETVNAMTARIGDISGDIKGLQASVTATNRLVERIDHHLLAKGE
ncbi:MAG: hypothetical protein DI527_16250 [Chelatococcus sp.]|nr:MAG: hypothetical protein DI527_16250 [Chelatococcus sp.]